MTDIRFQPSHLFSHSAITGQHASFNTNAQMYKCVSETWRIGTAKLTFVKYSSIKPWHETMGSEQTVCLSFSPVIYEYHYCTNTLLCKNSLHIMKSLYSTLIKFTACRKSDFVISVSEKKNNMSNTNAASETSPVSTGFQGTLPTARLHDEVLHYKYNMTTWIHSRFSPNDFKLNKLITAILLTEAQMYVCCCRSHTNRLQPGSFIYM